MQKKIRVLYLIESLSSGGAERQLLNLILNIDKQRFEIYLLTWVDANFYLQEDQLSFTWLRLSRKGKFDLSAVRKGISLVNEKNIDIIHGFLDTGNLYANLISKLSRRKPLVVCSERNSNRIKKGFVALHKKWSHRNATITVANSDAGAQYLRELGIDDSNLAVIRNGFDLSRFTPPSDRKLMREKVGFPEGKNVVICVARLTHQKNQVGLIEAFDKSRLKENSVLYLIGSENSEYVQGLRNLIGEKQLKDKVLIMPPSNHIEQYYQAADLFVLFSYFEGSPNTLVEAMSCALPVISSDAGDAGYYLNDKQSGWLVDIADTPALTEAFDKFHGLPAESRKEMGEFNAKAIRNLPASMRELAGEHEKLYTTLVTKNA